MIFRTGAFGESYVFNASGQTLGLEDLVVGCSTNREGSATCLPVISPIKDSELAKTRAETSRVAAAIYAPAGAVSASELEDVCRRFASWLDRCGSGVALSTAVLEPGDLAQL